MIFICITYLLLICWVVVFASAREVRVAVTDDGPGVGEAAPAGLGMLGMRERVAALGGTMIDGPVSGGVPRAKTGQLAIMVGGDSDAIDRAMPILSAMGTSVLKTGGVGSGQAMKALNNMVSTGGFLIGIEALLIGQRFGLDPAVMTDVLNAATGMNNSTQKKFKQFVLSRKFDAGFTMGLLAKDLSIAMQVGRETGTSVPLSALVNEMIVSAQAKFGPNADHTEMARLCELLAGSELEAG